MAAQDVNMADLDVPDTNNDFNMESPSDVGTDELSDTDESSVDEDASERSRGLPLRELPTGLCYDERMRYHAEVQALSAEAVHPEDPRRIYYIFKELCEAGLVVAKGFDVMVNQPLLRIDAREATEEEIRLVHSQDQFDFVRSTKDKTNEYLIDLADREDQDSIYYNKLSFYSGKLSAGGAIETCKAVMQGKVKNAIAVIRPPGHHAEVQRPMGFCLFNNTCIASRVCQNSFDNCRKVLILDWDVHHGNGCQKAFYDDPNILYISLHVHENGRFYPPGPEGGMDRCGSGNGEGFNVNIPWETKGMGDGDYMYAFQHVVMPIATSFNPDLVIISAGFDAAAGDELGGCNVSPACYAHMTHMLMSLAGGKVAVCLEGGYNFRAISRSALAVTKTLMGEPPDRLEITNATSSAVKVIEQVKQVQSRYWKCMYPKAAVGGIWAGERLHDIIRQWQAEKLFTKYRLSELHILRDRISTSFEKQVMASINYEKKKHLLVLFHDPPDMLSNNNPLIAQQKPHDTWMLDGSQAYVEQAVQYNIGVIDVNMPEFITITADPKVDENKIHSHQTVAYNSQTTDVARIEAEKLASYLWDNYIEPYEFKGGIWLMGAGQAFWTIAKLIGEKENLYQRLSGVIAFVSDGRMVPISIVGNNNTWTVSWLREHSRTYVAKTHEIWRKAEQEGRNPSKKYGMVIKSDATILNSMMQAHLPDVFKFIKDTGVFGEVPEESSSDDVKASDSDAEERKPVRTQTFSSPPQSRPLTATATAESSAALRGALSPPRGGTYSQTLSPSSAMQYGMTSPSRSPAPPQPSFTGTSASISPPQLTYGPPKIVRPDEVPVSETFNPNTSTGAPGFGG